MARETLTAITIPAQTAAQIFLGLFVPPDNLCCNCGAGGDLSQLVTPVPVADFSSERAVRLPFPYCDRCRPTAERPPPRLGRTLSLFPVVFFALVIAAGGCMSLVGHHFRDDDFAPMFLGPTVLGVVLPAWLLRWKPPEHAGQTSRYQAVRVQVHKSLLGKSKAITFFFTNVSYARRFSEAYERAKEAMPQVLAPDASLVVVGAARPKGRDRKGKG
jgi:hypothetical protein